MLIKPILQDFHRYLYAVNLMFRKISTHIQFLITHPAKFKLNGFLPSLFCFLIELLVHEVYYYILKINEFL